MVEDFSIPIEDGASYVVRELAPRSLCGLIRTKAGAEIVDVPRGNEAVLLRRLEIHCGNAVMPREFVLPDEHPASVALHHFRYGKRGSLTVFLDLRGDEESPYAVSTSSRPPVLHGPMSLAEVLVEIREFRTSHIAARVRKHAGDHDSL